MNFIWNGREIFPDPREWSDSYGNLAVGGGLELAGNEESRSPMQGFLRGLSFGFFDQDQQYLEFRNFKINYKFTFAVWLNYFGTAASIFKILSPDEWISEYGIYNGKIEAFSNGVGE